MTPVSRRIALTALLVVSLTATAAAQSRRAVPRTATPPSQPPASAPAPQRAAEPRRQGTDNQGRARAPRDNDGGGDRTASRGEPRERSRERTEERAAPPPAVTNAAPASGATASTSSSGEEQRRAVPRGSRPRGDNPAVGRAEPRTGRVYDGGDYRRGSRVYTSRGRVYNNYYYYYPRRWYPYGYGAFGGLGYFYYDPYTWYSYDPYWSRPHYYGSYGYSGHYDPGYYYDTGELRLQVRPRDAEVYVDGYFAGNVDDFDGTFQALRLEEGPHKIEIVYPGHETLEFDVRIEVGRKITYRGELRPRP